MAGEASSSHLTTTSLSVDDLYFWALYEDETIFPVSDEKYAEDLQFQEAIVSSFIPYSIRAAREPEDAPPTKRLNPQASSSRITCMICMDTKTTSDMFSSSSCSHTFCVDCISKYVAVRIQDNIGSVKCPDPKCEAVLDPQSCNCFVPKQVFERWSDALFEAMVMGTKRTYCPFEDCSAVMVDDGGEAVTETECQNCRRLFCAECKVGWHAEMECGEFQELRKSGATGRDDVLTMKLAERKKWRRCPNCKIFVEKITGCLHITCRCRFEFCYGCGSKWSSSHACPAPIRS